MTVADQLASGQVPIAYFAELDFADAALYLTTWNHNLEWGARTWVGLGSLVGISKLANAETPAYPALDLTLAVGDPALLAKARGNTTNYRGRDATLYRYVMSDTHQYLGEPELVWAGEMSQVLVSTGNGADEGGNITLRCEQRGRAQRSSQSLRLTSAQHELRYPGDTALRRKEALLAKPQTWLSKKFQQI